jgi:hypothetical protein
MDRDIALDVIRKRNAFGMGCLTNQRFEFFKVTCLGREVPVGFLHTIFHEVLPTAVIKVSNFA